MLIKTEDWWEIVDPFLDHDYKYLRFQLEVIKGRKIRYFDGVYRVHDPEKGPDYTLVSIKSQYLHRSVEVFFRDTNHITNELKEMAVDLENMERNTEEIKNDIDEIGDTLPDEDMVPIPKQLPAAQLPKGWKWYCWADGSGALYSPNEKKSYFGYDLQTREYKNIKNEWCYFCFDSFDAYCDYSEQFIAALLKSGNSKQNIESA